MRHGPGLEHGGRIVEHQQGVHEAPAVARDVVVARVEGPHAVHGEGVRPEFRLQRRRRDGPDAGCVLRHRHAAAAGPVAEQQYLGSLRCDEAECHPPVGQHLG